MRSPFRSPWRNPEPLHAGSAEGRLAPWLGAWGYPPQELFYLFGGGGWGEQLRPCVPYSFSTSAINSSGVGSVPGAYVLA